MCSMQRFCNWNPKNVIKILIYMMFLQNHFVYDSISILFSLHLLPSHGKIMNLIPFIHVIVANDERDIESFRFLKNFVLDGIGSDADTKWRRIQMQKQIRTPYNIIIRQNTARNQYVDGFCFFSSHAFQSRTKVYHFIQFVRCYIAQIFYHWCCCCGCHYVSFFFLISFRMICEWFFSNWK